MKTFWLNTCYYQKARVMAPANKKAASKPASKTKSDPCWEGYEKVGMKEKNGKLVPNCVPVKKASKKKSD
jgi:hypothetical protein